MISRNEINKILNIVGRCPNVDDITIWKNASIFHTYDKNKYDFNYCNAIADQIINEDRKFNLPFKQCLLVDEQMLTITGSISQSEYSLSLIAALPFDVGELSESVQDACSKFGMNNILGGNQGFAVTTILVSHDLLIIVTYAIFPIINDDGFQNAILPISCENIYLKRERQWTLIKNIPSLNNIKFDDMIKDDSSFIINYLSLLNDTTKFVVERKYFINRSSKKKKKNKKHSHSNYFVKSSRKIKNLIHESQKHNKTDHSLTVGHARRGYYRTLRSPKFVNAQGKEIWIKPTWVGPTSYTMPDDPNKEYVVRLDI